jgi:hypothetical protein
MQSFDIESLLETAASLRRIARTLVDRKIAAKLNAIAADLEVAALANDSRECLGETVPNKSELCPRN